MPGPPPLYGTCTHCTPVMYLNSSPERWLPVPEPLDPMLIEFGLALASAMRSFTVFTGEARFAVSMLGNAEICVMPVRSRVVSYGRFLRRLGLMVIEDATTSSV